MDETYIFMYLVYTTVKQESVEKLTTVDEKADVVREEAEDPN